MTTVEVVPAGPEAVSAALCPVTIPSGLGPHKWCDRRLLDYLTAQAALGPDEHLLLTDSNGDILETDRANVFTVINGVLCTPPADGRILPGIARAEMMRRADASGIPVKESPLTLSQLCESTELFVTNSVHGVIPARLRAPGYAETASDQTTRSDAARLGSGHTLTFNPNGRRAEEAPSAPWPHGPVATQLLGGMSKMPAAGAIPPGTLWSCRRQSGSRTPGNRFLQRRPRWSRPLVVLVDNYDSFTYNLAHLLRVTGCDIEVVRNDEVTPDDIKTFAPDGIVISPGPCTPAEAGISIAAVQTCGPVIPLLGICLGHQAIAAAYGTRIVRAPEPAHGYASPVTHVGTGVLAGLPQHFLAARYHSLIVDEGTLSADLRITARGPNGIPMALRHTVHPVEGLQFHPESILTPQGRSLIANWRRTLDTRRQVLRGAVISGI